VDLRNEVFSHEEKLWILCIGQEVSKKPLSPLLDMVDWYNNQLLGKGLLQNQIPFEFGSKTLLATMGFLPVTRLLIFGIGDEKNLTATDAKNFLGEVDKALEGLGEKSPWIIFSDHTSTDFINEINKGRTRLERLSSAAVSPNKGLIA
jgi:hypothetical protein